MDSDEVTSIDDTVESQQVAKVIRTAYFDLIQRAKLPEHYELVQLTETDASTPIIMSIPTTVAELGTIKYYDEGTTPSSWIPVEYVTLPEFLNRMDSITDLTATDVDTFTYTIDGADFTFVYKNNLQPTYYTVHGDDTVIFNGLDTAVDSFLQGTKTRAYARMQISWSMTDGFTPDLDEPQFNLLLSEAKALAWAELKQSPHQKAEQSARRGWNQLQKSKYASETLSDFEQLPNFGRKMGFYQTNVVMH
jgi:hypothetical protein